MSKKYIATIDLYFDKQKYTIVGETDTKKLELIELVKQFASKGRMECRVKEKKLFKPRKSQEKSNIKFNY